MPLVDRQFQTHATELLVEGRLQIGPTVATNVGGVLVESRNRRIDGRLEEIFLVDPLVVRRLDQ